MSNSAFVSATNVLPNSKLGWRWTVESVSQTDVYTEVWYISFADNKPESSLTPPTHTHIPSSQLYTLNIILPLVTHTLHFIFQSKMTRKGSYRQRFPNPVLWDHSVPWEIIRWTLEMIPFHSSIVGFSHSRGVCLLITESTCACVRKNTAPWSTLIITAHQPM